MRAALYLWRATAQRSWRTVLTVALIGGLFGAVALGAVAGARRTASAYGRYLTATKASDAFVNVPGIVPGMSLTEPVKLIAALPGSRPATRTSGWTPIRWRTAASGTLSSRTP